MARHLAMTDGLAAYVLAHGTREVAAQRGLRAATAGHRWAGMQIGADQGAFMGFLIKALGVSRALEIGTFTGYSALCVALALPADGRLVACDVSREFTDVGRPFWEEAGVAGKIDLRIGPAVETLDGLIREGARFGFAFIDADKPNYDAYYERCLVLVEKGGVIAIDNVLWSGAVAEPGGDADTLALKALNAKVQADERVDMCLLPVGDGVTLVRVR